MSGAEVSDGGTAGSTGRPVNEPVKGQIKPGPLGTLPAVRDAVSLAVNGEMHTVRGAQAMGTLSSFLRETLRLTGTKIVCSEGDCGACTVLVGSVLVGSVVSGDRAEQFSYRTIDSCIAFVYQLDRCHIVTVDGLSRKKNAQAMEDLHPVQRAMAENYGSQCGFCTPGFVVAISDLVDRARHDEGLLEHRNLCTALSGNLCRCTGYVQIAEAVRAVDAAELPTFDALFNEAPILAAFAGLAEQSLVLEHENALVEVPATEEQVLAARRQRPKATVVAGGTDLGVRFNKGQFQDPDRDNNWLHLRDDLQGFSTIRWQEETRQLAVGATVRWSDALPAFEKHVPEFAEILRRFGGPQIRNMGTVGGNLMNASPIADALPFLFVSDALLELAAQGDRREVPIADFYLGYKSLDIKPEELLRSVRFSVADPAQGERIFLHKISRRHDLDISTFTAALWLGLGENGRIATVRLAYGGVGPTVLRLPKTEAALTGQEPCRRLFEEAGRIAATEITPISDVRGAAAYRLLLARNVMVRFWEQLESGREAQQ